MFSINNDSSNQYLPAFCLVSLDKSLFISVSFCLYQYKCVFICLCFRLYLHKCIFISVSVPVLIYLNGYLSLSLFLSLSVSQQRWTKRNKGASSRLFLLHLFFYRHSSYFVSFKWIHSYTYVLYIYVLILMKKL